MITGGTANAHRVKQALVLTIHSIPGGVLSSVSLFVSFISPQLQPPLRAGSRVVVTGVRVKLGQRNAGTGLPR